MYGGGFKFLGIQLLGVGSTIAWTAVVITLVFTLIKKTIGLRADAADEAMGLDRSEHGLVTAYSGFSILPDGSLAEAEIVPAPVPAEAAEAPRRAKEKAPSKSNPWSRYGCPLTNRSGFVRRLVVFTVPEGSCSACSI